MQSYQLLSGVASESELISEEMVMGAKASENEIHMSYSRLKAYK